MTAASHHETCSLLPGLFGVLVQGLLFLASVGTLVMKKYREDMLEGPRARSWPTFLMDSSKQLLGAGWVHVVNLLCAHVLGASLEGNGCEWYWVNIMVDTTAGVGIEYLFLWLFTEVFEALTGEQGIFHSGDYKDRHGILIPKKYVAQLSVWLLCVTAMKILVVLFMFALHVELNYVASHFVGLFTNPHVQLIVVMVVTPCCMNAFQLWLTDAFIKRKTPEVVVNEVMTNSDVEQPQVLLNPADRGTAARNEVSALECCAGYK